jgi:hypothetical protein
MATAVVGKGRLHGLEGFDYEQAYLEEVSNFKDAALRVDGNDIVAALILRDERQFELLRRLHQRKIHVVGQVDEDSKLEDLKFEPV